MSIRKIQKSEIDFNKIHGTSASAMSKDDNTIKAIEKYWGDTGDLYFDDETGLITEDGVGLGFINAEDLIPIENISEEKELTSVPQEKDYSKIYDTTAEEAQKIRDGVIPGSGTTNDGESIVNIDNNDNVNSGEVNIPAEEETIPAQPEVPTNDEVNIDDIIPQEVTEETTIPEPEPTPEPTPSSPAVSADNAAVAAALGLTPEQLDIVKATIRHEAGPNLQEMANVASVVKNRMNKSGNNAYSTIVSPNQFESYEDDYYKKFLGRNYADTGASDADGDALINGILMGTIPPTHNYSFFNGRNSKNGEQLTPNGNHYH